MILGLKGREDAVVNGTAADIILSFWFGDEDTNRYLLAMDHTLSDIIELSDEPQFVEKLHQLEFQLNRIFVDYDLASHNLQNIRQAEQWLIDTLMMLEELEQADEQTEVAFEQQLPYQQAAGSQFF